MVRGTVKKVMNILGIYTDEQKLARIYSYTKPRKTLFLKMKAGMAS